MGTPSLQNALVISVYALRRTAASHKRTRGLNYELYVL